MDWQEKRPAEIKAYLAALDAPAFDAAWTDYIQRCGGETPKGMSALAKRHHEYRRICEMAAFDLGFGPNVAGVDEAGRGPLAGPVYAAAVILGEGELIEGVNDSKRLSPARRETLFYEITAKALAWCVASVSHEVIDEVNILNASMLAMAKAVAGLGIAPGHTLIDGNCARGMAQPCTCVVKGDGKSLSVAAASILAKVSRDRHLVELDGRYPAYRFCEHKGYGTALHLDLIRRHGPSPVHRMSFLKKIWG